MLRLALAMIAVAVATAVLPASAAAAPPDKRPFAFTVTGTVTGICAFPVTVTSAISGHVIEFVDSTGAITRIHAHITSQDVFSANGNTLVGQTYTFTNFFWLDANGEPTAILARGVAEKIRLPNGKLFVSAGVIDFIAQNVDFSFVTDRGRTGDVDAFCAALAP
jgi:hypothetical protein